jgi:pimeloyl-ACP methyl ester carboxylesterase
VLALVAHRDLDDRLTLRKSGNVDALGQPPENNLWVALDHRDVVGQPGVRPTLQGEDRGGEVVAGHGEPIRIRSAATILPRDQPELLKLSKLVGQDRSGYVTWQPAGELTEAPGPEQDELRQDGQAPSVTQMLDGLAEGAVVVDVSRGHAQILASPATHTKFGLRTLRTARVRPWFMRLTQLREAALSAAGKRKSFAEGGGQMTVQSRTDQLDLQGVGHPDEVRDVYERILADARVRHRYIGTPSGRRVHLVEAGEGRPCILLHGGGTSSLSHLPLLAQLEGVRAINVDRPGFGLSDPPCVSRHRYRDAAIEFINEVADVLELESFALAGASGGGLWALWYALAHPERVRQLVLLTAIPLLPGTRVPALLQVMVTPVLGDLLARVRPSPAMVVRFMSAMGERDTIPRHPELVESLVAAGRDPIASAATLAEYRALLSPFGFRPSMRVDAESLRSLTVPTLVIWGDHDPTGSVEAARRTTSLIPDARLEVLPAGHVTWLGHARRVAELLSGFVRSDTSE